MILAVAALCVTACGDGFPGAAGPTPVATTRTTGALATTATPGTSTVASPATVPTATSAVPSTRVTAATVPTTVATTVATTTAPARSGAPTGMVDVTELEPSIVVSIGKVTSDNVTGQPVAGYEANRAYLLPEGAQALARVQRSLSSRNLGLKVWDAFRPVRATQALVAWTRSIGRDDLIGPYIASVSYHNSGQAVDLTLVDRTTGRELDMGTAYDAFTPRANTANASGAVAANRAILVEAMEAAGFENYEGEWWHFNFFVPGAPNLDEPVR